MIRNKRPSAIALSLAVALVSLPAAAKDKAKVAFIGPLTGGVAANGIGARNSAELAVKLRNADPRPSTTTSFWFSTTSASPMSRCRWRPRRAPTAR